MPQINYEEAKRQLASLFATVLNEVSPEVSQYLSDNRTSLDIVFQSKTQSYREVLLGCAIAHLLDLSINIRLPYVKQGENSFNGRTLDENVINPFFQENLIPCSKGPYLATFRRNVKLTSETRDGLRDKNGYDSMLLLLSAIENTSKPTEAANFVACLLKRFLSLRDESRVPLVRINRLSIEQYKRLLQTLVCCPSGGLIPVLVTVALFQTLNETYSLSWDVTWQGINAADGATGAEGDITVKKGDELIMAIEVTERPIDQRRVLSTFNTKILQGRAKNYLFVYTNALPDETAKHAAQMLFSQGYDVNFVNLVELVINHFLSNDECIRVTYTDKILALLDGQDVPSSVKISWNTSIQSLIVL